MHVRLFTNTKESISIQGEVEISRDYFRTVDQSPPITPRKGDLRKQGRRKLVYHVY